MDYQSWPRKFINFPIIMIATAQQYIVALSLIWDINTHFATSVHVLALIFPVIALPGVLILTATCAIAAFSMKKKINTLLMLVPQQFLLYLSAGGAMEAFIEGHFADGIVRSRAFLVSDQGPVMLLAFFHTWAMMLILKYGADEMH